MEAGTHINASCGGSETCGKCKIDIIGDTADSLMHARLSTAKYEEGYRLACLTSINGDIDIEIPLESQVDKSTLSLKGDRGLASYLLSPKNIYQLVQGWYVDVRFILSDSSRRSIITAARIRDIIRELKSNILGELLILNRITGPLTEDTIEEIGKNKLEFAGTIPADEEINHFDPQGILISSFL